VPALRARTFARLLRLLYDEDEAMTELQRSATLHVRFEGRSLDVRLADLDIGPQSTDDQVKQALAVYLDVPVQKFRDYVVDRHSTGNMTVRPEAIFGWTVPQVFERDGDRGASGRQA
jgi:hypothetical protein